MASPYHDHEPSVYRTQKEAYDAYGYPDEPYDEDEARVIYGREGKRRSPCCWLLPLLILIGLGVGAGLAFGVFHVEKHLGGSSSNKTSAAHTSSSSLSSASVAPSSDTGGSSLEAHTSSTFSSSSDTSSSVATEQTSSSMDTSSTETSSATSSSEKMEFTMCGEGTSTCSSLSSSLGATSSSVDFGIFDGEAGGWNGWDSRRRRILPTLAPSFVP